MDLEQDEGAGLRPTALTVRQAQAQREAWLAGLADGRLPARLDLSAVEAFDSAGVQLLLSLQRSLQARGERLSIADASSLVRDVITLYGLQGLLLGAEDAS